ncbi:MAG: CRISPR-associated helicase Cas3' [Desulfobacula sp.]|uniref:CRISPR-associated helicase Cas3' n=2 Tax=Desulfobacula sp. TaxID=2593537 RepID=UPI001DC57757|nr:CRISPR-associated helicase Cas3' [Desulfobacula sp.]MBT3486565.1 CRISPR-associated helicase Cas3' [Desulfobacula sp.]MBT3805776.1 CRISPR-associated helicase Cas3' [Desulfobacula sp.]MBT4200365.1 CRISPR-associated helicase Cas3' [Desulfobacula sp.]MBT4508593.1 CRISPR-associated helicase Cas3' [Desulfobacula sp.]
MNLFDIEKKYWSHPNYPVQKHLDNIAASFVENSHKEAAFFHDTGKLTDEFQKYIKNPDHARRTTHALESALIYLMNKNYKITPESFAIFYAVLKHHGDLADTNNFLDDKLSFIDDLLETYPDLEKRLEKICDRIDLSLDLDLEEFCNLFDLEDFVEEYDLVAFENYFLIKDVFSRLIFSDKYEAIFKESYSEKKSHQWKTYISNLVKLIESKNNKMAFVRNQARKEIITTYKKNKAKRIFIIGAPTGIGKTFSALQLALEICHDKNKKRIINALPMTSIIDQTHEEYSLILGNNDLLKFHHLTHSKSYISHDNEGRKERESLSKQQNDFTAMSWSSDAVIVTTFNQLLNIFYSNKNRDLVKFWTIRDSVIILDEIQAIPRVLIQDLAKTITYLSKSFNIDFILMSATIPGIKQFIPKGIMAELLDKRYFSMDFNNRYSIQINTQINDMESLLSVAKTNYKNNNSLLCVVNSKKLSLDIYSELKDNLRKNISSSELFFLNTNIIPKCRASIISTIKKRLQKKQKTLLVSTQVVEAGVDLDFDFGIREFAPLYSMIQAAGRINRENREGLNKSAKLIVTGKIGYCPYHPTDLLKEEVIELFSSEINENRILPLLEKYFQIVMDRVAPDPLLYQNMQKLDFETVYHIYLNNFMKAIPNVEPVFVEIEKGLHQTFFLRIDTLHKKMKQPGKSMEEKMECRSKLKSILKKISQYVINVSKNETDGLQDLHEIVQIKVCPYEFVKNGTKYSCEKGWLGEKTLTLNF